MDSIQLNYSGDCIEDTSSEQLLSLEPQDSYNVFGEPQLLPRVGDQYQVEVPPLILEAEYLSYTKNPLNEETRDFLLGLPIPVMWIRKKMKNTEHEGVGSLRDLNDQCNKDGVLESKRVKEAKINLKEEDSNLGELPNLEMELEKKSRMHLKNCRGRGFCLVPGSLGDSWSDLEEASFLLGLYMFGKNLVLVKRFIESKNMGDILSFYYGKFFKSDGYRRWADCRKMRSRRSVFGPRIFTGLRLQELLSRLLPRVSEECQSSLLESSKAYGEGKISLEEFVFTLKAFVGTASLVEAVGIGEGKRDLTGMAIDPSSKSNHIFPTRPEIPIGKACSSLTPMEIIKFLTGDFRLSKARSNDLFWEAVWPRLLARGWHSEEPKFQIYAAGSKHSLVFLMPGVKKFSRRRLVKGDHYFDCVTDVLNKVASDPSLLELDAEADEGKRSAEENGWTNETKLEKNDSSDRQRHCYLQPRTPNRNLEMLKFTVVDTSMGDGKAFKMRELRTLPVEISKKIVSGSPEEESEADTSEVSTDESDTVDTMLFDQTDNNKSKPRKPISDMRIFSHEKDLEISGLNPRIPTSGPDSSNGLCEIKRPRKTIKSRSSRGLKEEKDYLAPITKRRRRLTACSRGKTSHGMTGPTSEQEKQNSCSDTSESSENNITQIGLSQKRFSSASSSKGSFACDTNSGEEENPQPRKLIDLNLPQNPPDIETGEVCMMEVKEGQDGQISKEYDDSSIAQASIDVTGSEEQPNMNSRRQGTRNRPPTARALEALANGYLTINWRKKGKETSPRGNSKSRPSRRARSEMGFTENSVTGTLASEVEESVNGVSNRNDTNDVFIKLGVLSEENDTQGTHIQM